MYSRCRAGLRSTQPKKRPSIYSESSRDDKCSCPTVGKIMVDMNIRPVNFMNSVVEEYDNYAQTGATWRRSRNLITFYFIPHNRMARSLLYENDWSIFDRAKKVRHEDKRLLRFYFLYPYGVATILPRSTTYGVRCCCLGVIKWGCWRYRSNGKGLLTSVQSQTDTEEIRGYTSDRP